MITEDYVSFENAKLLKEKEFNEPCRLYYDKYHGYVPIFVEDSKLTEYGYKEFVRNDQNSIFDFIASAPSLYIAMKWLREVHNIDIDIEAAVGMLGVKVYVPYISTYKPFEEASSKVRQIKRGIHYKDDQGVISALQYFDSYEEAVEAACLYVLKNLI